MGGMIRIREALNIAMVGNCKCRVAPFRSCFDIGINRCYRIHRAHGRMQVELHALLLSIVLTCRRCRHLGQIRRNHHQLGNLHEPVIFHFAARPDPFAVSQLTHDLQLFLGLREHLHLQGICKVCDAEGEQRIPVTQAPCCPARRSSPGL